MKKKKIISIALALVVILISPLTITNANAASKKLSTNEKVQKLEEKGLSPEKALYYAKVDDMVKEMEATGEKINITNDNSNVSNCPESMDTKEFRDKILNKDKSALRKAFNAQVYTHGIEDIQKVISKNKGQAEYVLQYPDGSKITAKFKTGQKNKVKVNTTTSSQVIPSTYESTLIDSGYNDNGDDWGDGSYTIESGFSYSDVGLYCEFSLDTDSNYAEMTYCEGRQDSYGVVSVANSTGGTITRAKYNATSGRPAEAANQVVLQASGSFGTNAGALSLSVNAGASWTQYAYFRTWGSDGSWEGVAAVNY